MQSLETVMQLLNDGQKQKIACGHKLDKLLMRFVGNPCQPYIAWHCHRYWWHEQHTWANGYMIAWSVFLLGPEILGRPCLVVSAGALDLRL